MPPFHVLTIHSEQLGTRAPCPQGDQNIMGVITEGDLSIAARIRGNHLASRIEILGRWRDHTPDTGQLSDHPIEVLFICTTLRPRIDLHPYDGAQEKPPRGKSRRHECIIVPRAQPRNEDGTIEELQRGHLAWS